MVVGFRMMPNVFGTRRIDTAKLKGKRLGRPPTVGIRADPVRKLFHAGVSKAEIARRMNLVLNRLIICPSR